jgi:winged helix DNA-binding protein
VELSGAAVRRARVRAQGLVEGAGGGGSGGVGAVGVGEVVGRVMGIQAQDAGAAALSIRPRGSSLVAGDVDRALAERSIVLTWTLRGTRHYHRAADVRWLVGLFGPVFGRPGRRARQLGIDGEVGERAVRALHRALSDSGPLTRAQVRDLLVPEGVDPSGQAPVHVLFRAACEGVLCVVPGPRSEGGERYVLLDDWVPPGAAPSDPAAELARRHLAAFGPATPADLAAWSGLPAGVVRDAWSAVAGDLVEVAGPDGPTWVLRDQVDALDGAAAGPAPVRMLGGFDTFLLGYADRGLHLPPEHARSVNAGGGIVRPIVLDDGRVVGTWSFDRRRVPEVTPFPDEHPDTAAEVAAIARFLAS